MNIEWNSINWKFNKPATENKFSPITTGPVTSSDRPCQCTLRKLHQILWIEFNFIAFVSPSAERTFIDTFGSCINFFLLLRFIRSSSEMEFMICEGKNGLRWIPFYLSEWSHKSFKRSILKVTDDRRASSALKDGRDLGDSATIFIEYFLLTTWLLSETCASRAIKVQQSFKAKRRNCFHFHLRLSK